jgi:hypothetical protein
VGYEGNRSQINNANNTNCVTIWKKIIVISFIIFAGIGLIGVVYSLIVCILFNIFTGMGLIAVVYSVLQVTLWTG